MLLTILDGMAGTMLGEEARMDKEERAMIEDPMARILERMDPGTSAMLEKWTDPVLLSFGFITWGIRVWAELTMGRDDDDAGRSGFEQVDRTPPNPSNGRKKEIVPDEEVVIDVTPPADIMDHIAHEKTLVDFDSA